MDINECFEFSKREDRRSVRRSRQVLVLNDKRRAILAALVFNCNGHGETRPGFRGTDIYNTCPTVFNRLFRSKNTNSALRAILGVTMNCKTLVRMGYLQYSNRVIATFRLPNANKDNFDTVGYSSPTFVLTEAGYTYVLGTCDERSLISLNNQYNKPRHWKSSIQGYDNMETYVETAFVAYSGIWLERAQLPGNIGLGVDTDSQAPV